MKEDYIFRCKIKFPLIFLFLAFVTSQLFSQRIVDINLADPRLSFEANSKAWYSLNQGFAYFTDKIDENNSANSNLIGRLGIFVASTWSNSMLRYYSHEIAHEVIYRKNNTGMTSSFDFTKWGNSFLPGIYYPRWKRKQNISTEFSDDEHIFAIASGLNQDEYNASTVWNLNSIKAENDAYDALSFLLTKFRDIDYILKAGSDETPFFQENSLNDLEKLIYEKTPHLFDDVNLYRLSLYHRGITISNNTLLFHSLIADLLSWHTWENFNCLYQYIFKNKSSTKFSIIDINSNFSLAPPLISHYFSGLGSFFNISSILNYKENQYRLALGIHPKNSQFRFGGEYPSLNMGKYFSVTPFGYINFKQWTKYSGESFGVKNSATISGKVVIWLKLEANRNDLFENFIKNEGHGFNTTMGVNLDINQFGAK